jgi:hypothetical protein
MTSLNVASIQFFKGKITQPPVHSHRSTGSPLTSHHYTITPLYDYTSPPLTSKPLHYYTTIRLHQFTSHHSLLISALGLIKFSIQWLWSIATNPSLELTGTTHHSLITKIHYTTIRLHHSRLTSHLSQLISALGLVEFSIQWLWSIATNPSLELTGTTHHSPLTTHY